jgi:hypothetical protein
MSSWKCLLYAFVCCLGSHTLEWSVRGVFIAPNTKLVVGEKLLLSVADLTVRCATRQSGAPDQTVCRGNTFFVSWTSLDLHNVFF